MLRKTIPFYAVLGGCAIETGYTLAIHNCHCFPELSLLDRQGAAVWGGRGKCLGKCTKNRIATASSLPWHMGLFPKTFLGVSLKIAGRDSGEKAAFLSLPSLSVIFPFPHQIIVKMKWYSVWALLQNNTKGKKKKAGIDWPWVAHCWSWFTGTWRLWLFYVVYKVCLKCSVIKIKLQRLNTHTPKVENGSFLYVSWSYWLVPKSTKCWLLFCIEFYFLCILVLLNLQEIQ